MKNKAAILAVRFLVRAVIGLALIYVINQYFLPGENSWKVGLNTVSFLTSGSLGIPGVCLLYSIMIYQNL